MYSTLITLLALLSPTAFVVVAIFSWLQPGLRPQLVKNISVIATLISLTTALVCGVFVAQYTLLESSFIGFNNIGLSIRLDAVSVLMLSMISILAFIIVKFSLNYLDGDARQGRFIGRLAATIAAVQLLVLSGNIGLLLISWILTSVSLHRLLVFYKERPIALVAARKKFIIARLGDTCLFLSLLLLYLEFETGNLELIFQAIKMNLSSGVVSTHLEFAALFLSFAALLKSAQFPTHGWLIEVMETPTPVSALLHAGLLNAGPFLLIRMAYLMDASTYAPILVVILGGFTALFASAAFLTQTSIKTALGYSSIAHMGFSLMVCGLGAYPAALLHLVAHSFYKAHAFLSSGSVIDVIRTAKLKTATRTGSPWKIALGIVLAMVVYIGFALLIGINPVEELSLIAVGGIIVMGLSTLFASAIDSNGSLSLTLRATVLAMAVAAAFFTLESGTHHLIVAQLPQLKEPNFAKTVLISIILLAFGTVTFIQILAPVLHTNATYRNLAIHLRNGFYANAIFDRIVGALRIQHVIKK